MESETKICQNCKGSFAIEPEDFTFYDKIKVSPPTFCPECRTQRRMMFRNERVLYKRNNNTIGKDGEQIISIHRPEALVTVYDDRTWWSDAWDPMVYGQEYDFSRPFFEQFKKLYSTIPLINLSVTNNVNCNFCNVSEGDKGCYMVSGSEHNEDTLYSNRIVENKQSSDLYIAFNNELCYDLTNCTKCYRTLFSANSQECADSLFLYNCKNCTDCIGCVNLRNKSHCILNQQYTREEYEKIKKDFALNTHQGISEFTRAFEEFHKTQFFKYANNVKSEGSTGDNILGVTRSSNTFDMQESEDLNYCSWGMKIKDSYDAGPGIGINERLYEVFDMLNNSDVKFSGVVYNSLNILYSINCHGSSNLFGCYGLRSKKYCILNKQYTKEEYKSLIPKIIQHMKDIPYIDTKARVFSYGEFFPYDISPFAYNETIAQDYFPITKEKAKSSGFDWYDREERHYQITTKNENIPENISSIKDEFINEIIECASKGDMVKQCTKAFKVISQELELYRKLDIPIPRYCYNCRYYNRLVNRNPLKLWHRSCMCDKEGHIHEGKCEVEFETSYAPERPEIIYCEKCYQQEVM